MNYIKNPLVNEYLYLFSGKNIPINNSNKILDLSNCKLTEIPKNIPKELEILSLGINNINNFNNLPEKLKTLYLYDNNIKEIPKHLKKIRFVV